MKEILKKQFINYINYVYPKKVVNKLPLNYKIEPISVCNLRCPICVDMTKDIQKNLMSVSTFKGIIDQIPERSKIDLFGYGESFLHKEIFQMIQYAKEKNHHIQVSSNFNLDKKLMQNIVESEVDSIIISLDGNTQESYQKYRVRGDISKVFSNIVELNELKQKLNKKKPQLIWQFIVNKYNEHEMNDAKLKAKELGVQIIFIPMGLAQDVLDGPYSKSRINELKDEWLPKNKKFLDPYFVEGQNFVLEDTRCPMLWEWMTIYANGTVTPCCKIMKPENTFGNVNDSSLLEIWNNEKFQNSRNLFIHNDRSNCDTLCLNCDNYVMKNSVSFTKRNIDFTKETYGKVLRKIKFKMPELFGIK
ncbi:MAG: SPASM domain-containing protein [SAR324 cluster bacterium]|nr:SPASM domain-containing protein [SAR324 cluster bacterium]